MKVIDYPNYDIKEDGTIININTNRILATCINKQTGYKMVHLWKDNKEKGDTIHRLLAIHFIPNPDNKPHVNHKNGNKQDDSIENLEWSTASENMYHAYKQGLKLPTRKIA